MEAAAINLHAFYSGLEHLFELAARQVDESHPSRPNGHSELLAQMAAPVADVRPAVISEPLQQQLDRYHGFRHVVRDVYPYSLDAAQLGLLVDGLSETVVLLGSELAAFADFLDAVYS